MEETAYSETSLSRTAKSNDDFRSQKSHSKRGGSTVLSSFTRGKSIEERTAEHQLQFAGYCVKKWMMNHNMKERIAAVHAEYIEDVRKEAEGKEADGSASVGIPDGLFQNASSAVDDYWNKKESGDLSADYSDPARKRAVLIIHAAMRNWKELSAMRKNSNFLGYSMESKVEIVQNVIRKFLAFKKVKHRESKMETDKTLFSKFCTYLSQGIVVRFFSRKYGDVQFRTLKLDVDCKSIIYATNAYGTQGKIHIKDIYQVERGTHIDIGDIRARAISLYYCYYF